MWRPYGDDRVAAAIETCKDIAGGKDPLFDAYVTPERDSSALTAGIEALAAGGIGMSLFGGALGVGWSVAHLAGGDDADRVCASIDRVFGEMLARGWTGDYDLVDGLVGVGVYGLERDSSAILLGVLDALEIRAVPMASGLGWRSSPDRVPELGEYFDLGVAHGVAGVVALLARYLERGIEVERVRRLLEGAVGFLLDVPDNPAGRFPSTAGRLRGVHTSPLAWCYGDLGVSLSLLAAARVTSRDAWRAEALKLALSCSTRDRVDGPGLCHGAAGAAHLFARLHAQTGDDAFRAAACRWLDRTLAADIPADASLLGGATGIGLVLTAAVSTEDPAWDRLLLIS